MVISNGVLKLLLDKVAGLKKMLRVGSLDEAKQTIDSEHFHKRGLRIYEIID